MRTLERATEGSLVLMRVTLPHPAGLQVPASLQLIGAASDFSGLAQRLERPAHNRKVNGSSPLPATNLTVSGCWIP